MPAVELSRLKNRPMNWQAAFSSLLSLDACLVDRLEFYADRVTRQGNMVKPGSSDPPIRCSAVIHAGGGTVDAKIRRLNLQRLRLTLAQELWKEAYLEPRLIAATLDRDGSPP